MVNPYRPRSRRASRCPSLRGSTPALSPARRSATVALFAIAVLGTGCATAGVTTTDAQGSTTSRVGKPPGTILVVDPSGETAAAALGKTIAVIPPPTTEAPTTTTTTAPATTLPVTTQAPVTTPRPTVATTPPVTSGGPVTSLGSLKPPLVPMSAASLSADEQAIVNGINARRAASGLAGVAPELHATELARQHTAAMVASGQPSNIADVFNQVNAQYKTITQLTFNWAINEDPTQYILTQYGSQISGPFTSIGIGVTVNAGQRWVTVLLGA